MAGGQSGYRVNTQTLQAWARAAGQIAQDVDGLIPPAAGALATGAEGGLQIGAALAKAEIGWKTQLSRLAAEATAINSRLSSNAAAYDDTEDSVLEILEARGREFAA